MWRMSRIASMIALMVAVIVAPCRAEAPAGAAEKPNIVLVIADDLTYHDVGCYGNADVITPNIDRLAAQGMRFDRCFTATAMCAPTRQQLYTGLFPVRNGAYPNHSRVYPGTRSIVHHLRGLGYRVGLSGKTHFRPAESFPFDRVKLSAEGWKAYIEGGGDEPFCLVVASHHSHKPWDSGDPSAYDAAKLTVPPYLVDVPETRQEMTRYYAEVTALDGQVGELMKIVDEAGLADRTIFIFTSEQGSNFTHSKWTCYDTGLRTALVVRWPGRVEPGSTTQAMVQYVDFTPTFIEAAGGDPAKVDTGRPGAADGGHGFDGRSFLPVLLGDANAHHDYVYGIHTTRGIINGSESYPIRSIRDRRYKYIRNLAHETTFTNVVTRPERWDLWKAWIEAAKTDAHARAIVEGYQHRPAEEFYDLETDPYELNNLAADPAHRARMDALGAKLDAWMKQQGDRGVETEMQTLQRQGKAGKQESSP